MPSDECRKMEKMESILDEYKIKPIVGVIPEIVIRILFQLQMRIFGEKHVNGKKRLDDRIAWLHHELYFHEPEGTTSFRTPEKQNGREK